MSKRPARSGGNPYKVLYWMGAGVGLLLLGVVALAVLMKPEPREVPDPERTVLWLYDEAAKDGPAVITIIEESRKDNALHAVPMPAPEEARKTFKEGGARRAVDTLAASLQRQIHHRVFLPYGVVTTLIDAFGGIRVESRDMNGGEAVSYIKAGGDQGARRATAVMLGLADAASTRQPNLGMSEALGLARMVDTDLELMSLPDVLGRWSRYPSPQIEAPASFDPAALQKLLLPDPTVTIISRPAFGRRHRLAV